MILSSACQPWHADHPGPMPESAATKPSATPLLGTRSPLVLRLVAADLTKCASCWGINGEKSAPGCEIVPNSDPGTGALKCLIQLLFPAFSEGHDRRLLEPQPTLIFAMKSADYSCSTWGRCSVRFHSLDDLSCPGRRSRRPDIISAIRRATLFGLNGSKPNAVYW
jgi:hypothetical protein